MEDNTKDIKDIILAEYTSLRNVILQREGSQNTVIGWLMVLIGSFIGLSIAKIPSGMDKPLILSYIFYPDKEVITLFFIVCTGFTLGIEVLLSYWIYNRYCMLLIHRYILLIEARLRKSLNIGDDLDILSWERMSPKILLSEKKRRIRNFFVYKIAFLQPFSLYFFSIIGIGLIASGFCKTESCILIIIFWFLLIVLFIQMYIHYLLWVYSNPNISIKDLKS